jgi:hypothetical protein
MEKAAHLEVERLMAQIAALEAERDAEAEARSADLAAAVEWQARAETAEAAIKRVESWCDDLLGFTVAGFIRKLIAAPDAVE